VGLGTSEGGRGKHRRGWTAEGGEQRKQRRGGGTEERGMGRGGEISPPRSFLKVSAYACDLAEAYQLLYFFDCSTCSSALTTACICVMKPSVA